MRRDGMEGRHPTKMEPQAGTQAHRASGTCDALPVETTFRPCPPTQTDPSNAHTHTHPTHERTHTTHPTHTHPPTIQPRTRGAAAAPRIAPHITHRHASPIPIVIHKITTLRIIPAPDRAPTPEPTPERCATTPAGPGVVAVIVFVVVQCTAWCAGEREV